MMDINQKFKEILFEDFIGRSNTGKYVTLEEFKKEESRALTKDDTNPATRPLPEEKSCEFCKKDLENSQELKCKGCFRVRYCGKKCQQSHLESHKPNCKLQCEVIFTYSYKKLQGQQAYNVYMDSNITEKEFVTQILDTIPLKAKNMHDLHHLMKLSTCTFTGKRGIILPFLDKNNGKYFFNNKISPAPSTKLWENFLKKYMETRTI
jgi:hypothetical protein